MLAFAGIVTFPLVSAQLNSLAQKAGKVYFGTATDNPELTGNATNAEYVSILSDRFEFGQITPANTMKVSLSYAHLFRNPRQCISNQMCLSGLR